MNVGFIADVFRLTGWFYSSQVDPVNWQLSGLLLLVLQ